MILPAVPAVAAALYYLLALLAGLRRLRERFPKSDFLPTISILKPVRGLAGLDPRFYECIRSHATQDYPNFEIVFGVGHPEDPVIKEIDRLIREFPERRIRLVVAHGRALNGKVGVLTELATEARHSILLVNDGDIWVPPDYLRKIVRPLENPGIGMVTCLYRASSAAWPGRWEAIGIATEFAPSVLVARMLGMAEFALGSTMLFRAEQLHQIGGFAVLNEYLADDYQLGKRISDLGYRVALAETVVTTNLNGETWAEVWRHQLRWARTIRVSRAAGYYGYVLTQATLWCLLAAMAGAGRIALTALAIRMIAGIVVGAGVLKDRQVARHFYLIPLRDLWGFAIWVCGLFNNTVEWRGEKLTLTRDGKILNRR